MLAIVTKKHSGTQSTYKNIEEVFLLLLFSMWENVVEFSLIAILGLFPSYSSLEELGMIKDA